MAVGDEPIITVLGAESARDLLVIRGVQIAIGTPNPYPAPIPGTAAISLQTIVACTFTFKLGNQGLEEIKYKYYGLQFFREGVERPTLRLSMPAPSGSESPVVELKPEGVLQFRMNTQFNIPGEYVTRIYVIREDSTLITEFSKLAGQESQVSFTVVDSGR